MMRTDQNGRGEVLPFRVTSARARDLERTEDYILQLETDRDQARAENTVWRVLAVLAVLASMLFSVLRGGG